MEEDLLNLLTFFTQTFAEEISKYQYKNIKIGKDAFILDYIGKKNICTQSDLVIDLNLSKSATSRRINRLVGVGLISRKKRDEDHRWENLTLTDIGDKAYINFLQHRQGLLKVLTSSLEKEELELFRTILNNFKEKYTANEHS